MSHVVVIGGAGRAGLPLALALVNNGGHEVVIIDQDQDRVQLLGRGVVPFQEEGGQEALHRAHKSGRLTLSDLGDLITPPQKYLQKVQHIVIAIGTPSIESGYFEGTLHEGPLRDLLFHLIETSPTAHICVRSTISIEFVQEMMEFEGCVTYCPERTIEGRGLVELAQFPQLVGAVNNSAFGAAEELFAGVAPRCIRLSFGEAALAKLYTNAMRYVNFALGNELFIEAKDLRLNYHRVYAAMVADYPRCWDLAPAGLTGGPCLPKDTLALGTGLGEAAIQVHQRTVLALALEMSARFSYTTKICVLGRTFKADSDDLRGSPVPALIYALKGYFGTVISHDPIDRTEIPTDVDAYVVAIPHTDYRAFESDKPILDLWGITKNGERP